MNNIPKEMMHSELLSAFGIKNVATDVVPLPSCGLFYPPRQDGTPIDSIEVAYMTTKDENILLSPSYINQNITLEKLVEAKMLDRSIRVHDMLYGDFETILIFLRKSAYGQFYKVLVTDPETGEEFNADIDLEEIEYEFMKDKPSDCKPDENGLFEFMLPNSKINVKFKLLTLGEQRALSKMMEAKKKSRPGDTENIVTDMMFAHIEALMNPNTKTWMPKSQLGQVLTSFIETMSPIDYHALKNRIKEVTPGVKTEYEFVSPSGNRFRTSFQFGADFLYVDFKK